jgi:hypothetical protein
VPDDRRRLADGLLVEASVVARLFRVRLLAIEASLVITPADVRAGRPGGRPRPIGPGLAAAVRVIEEGEASLAASRRRR